MKTEQNSAVILHLI